VGEGELAVVVVRVSRGAIIIHLDQRGTVTLVLCCFIHIYIYILYSYPSIFNQTATRRATVENNKVLLSYAAVSSGLDTMDILHGIYSLFVRTALTHTHTHTHTHTYAYYKASFQCRFLLCHAFNLPIATATSYLF